ncbi:MAG: hypothetical protein RLZ98_1444 [Pseudomonadota bacterium]|jgi:L-alanine-DL-glutamate epimerase-like enolase superfamily enzyme
MGERIAKVETYRVRLPYNGEVKMRSVQDTTCPYLLLRIETVNGAAGIAEIYARPAMSDGTDTAILAHQINQLFKPALLGAEAGDIWRIMSKARVRASYAARSLIDIAAWDLKGKLMGVPVWKLIGSGPAKPVPVTKVVFGNTAPEMVEDAVASVKRGYRSLKIKVWKRSQVDIDMVRDIRKAVGDDVYMYVDANTTYTEAEARRYFPKLQEYGVALLEDPCLFTSIDRMADMQRDLPIPMMADAYNDGLSAVYELIARRATGAVSTKLRRPGLTDTLKIIGLCEAANIPAVIGTDLESRVGVMARIHLRTAVPYLESWPAELQFFEQLADDCLDGDIAVEDGMIQVLDKPGFGAGLDMAKVEKFLER